MSFKSLLYYLLVVPVCNAHMLWMYIRRSLDYFVRKTYNRVVFRAGSVILSKHLFPPSSPLFFFCGCLFVTKIRDNDILRMSFGSHTESKNMFIMSVCYLRRRMQTLSLGNEFLWLSSQHEFAIVSMLEFHSNKHIKT